MKKALRVLMLIGAFAFYAAGASAQILTECWKNSTEIPGVSSGGDIRFASAKDGKIIAIDYVAKKIISIDDKGVTEIFDLSESIATYYSKEETVFDEVTGEESVVSVTPNANSGITVDDAGNILVGVDFSKSNSSTDMIIISADLKDTYKLQLSLPEGVSANRIDQYGKIVGDMLSEEGAYLWLAINANERVAIVKIANGKQVEEYSQASAKVEIIMNSSTIAQPAMWNVAEIDALMDNNNKNLSPTFWSRNRRNPEQLYGWNEDGTEQVLMELTEKDANGITTKTAGAEGFATFNIAGVTYLVVPMSLDGSSRSCAIGIYDETGKLRGTYNPNDKTGFGQMGSIVVESDGEYAVNIYRFIPGTIAYKLNFYDIGTLVEDIEREENEEAVYYNFQGVKIAKPANGVFIKVQGGKASKVLVK